MGAKIIAHSLLTILASDVQTTVSADHSVKFDSALSTWNKSSSASALVPDYTISGASL
jgi:hypothetical protein